MKRFIPVLLAVWLLVPGCRERSEEPGELQRVLVLVEKKSVRLGSFDLSTGTLVATDPAYELETARIPGLGAIVKNCANGEWTATVIKKRFEGENWAIPSELLVCHSSVTDQAGLRWNEVPKGLGADTGQVGIWELKHFHDRSVVPENTRWSFGPEERPAPAIPDDLWYSLCCELTSGDAGASLMPHGAVSRSGYGDGGYPVFTALDSSGRVIGLWVRFIDDQGGG